MFHLISHDYHQNPEAQLDYSFKQLLGINHTNRWAMPGRYYHKEFKFPRSSSDKAAGDVTVLILFIDTPILAPLVIPQTSPNGINEVSPEQVQAQLAYIEDVLASSTADWKIVAGHYTGEQIQRNVSVT